MPNLLRSAITALSSAALLGTVYATGHFLVVRRRSGGMVRLTEAIPVNAAYWFEQRIKSGDLLYLAIGDSAAQGIGASRPSRSYVGLLARAIREQTGKRLRVVNASQSGGRLREALARSVPTLKKLEPDIVTVAIGTNDIPEFDPSRFELELRKLYAALPPFAIVADLPCFYFGEYERRVVAANRIVHAVAAEYGFAVAPLYSVTRGRTAARTALRDVAADFFHPNDRGYAVWASAFEPLVLARARHLDIGREAENGSPEGSATATSLEPEPVTG